ncbi:MAG: 5'-methylthioadenosine/adenosylhomocysteine nucleosidase [Clostridia bacterium]|nr:5'-methylthioadenosine/adenosylhomocysteine nucleosidase [Clostridia bacterium]
MIGFIGAMQLELDGIQALMTEKQTETVSGIQYVSGRLGKNRIVTAVCGIGKVFAAICTQTMILRYSPTLIINTGVAGAISPLLSIGDVVVADKVVQHDMDTSPIGDPVGLISGINKIFFDTDKKTSDTLAESLARLNINTLRGTVATGDQFVSSTEKKTYLRDAFGAVSCEMEGGSIGHVCYVNSVPFAILRSISDKADEGATVDYPSFARTSAERYVNVIADFAENWRE